MPLLVVAMLVALASGMLMAMPRAGGVYPTGLDTATPTQLMEARVEPKVGSVLIRRHSDGLFYLTAPVNGQPVRFIVDTGASMVVLGGADAARTGVLSGAPVAAITAGGSSAMNRATIARLDLAGRRLHDVQAVIASEGQVSLIGQNALSQLDSVSFKGNELIIR